MPEPSNTAGDADSRRGLWHAIRSFFDEDSELTLRAQIEEAISEAEDENASGEGAGNDLTSYVGSDDVKAGTMEAEAIAKAMGGKGNVVIIEGPVGQSGEIERGRGNRQVLAQHPEMKILEHKTANWSRAEAQALIREFAKAKERFAECERYGRFHPDYNEALDQVYAWERRLNEVECIRRFKAAEEALDRLLYEVSLTLARAVSDTIKVPDNDPNPKGCGNGGRCSCSGGCG